MGDWKDDAISYLNDFGNNLGKKFGLDDKGDLDIEKELDREIGELKISDERKRDVDSQIEDIPEELEAYLSQDTELRKKRNPFLEKSLSVFNAIKEKNKGSNKYRKEYLAIEAFTLGTVLSFAGSVHPVARFIGAPLLIKVGYTNSDILQKVFSRDDIERYTHVKLEDAFKK